jgi:hypothetical protein
VGIAGRKAFVSKYLKPLLESKKLMKHNSKEVKALDNTLIDIINKVRVMAKNQRGGEHPWEAMSDLELLKSANLYGRDLNTGKEGINLAGILLLGTQQ